MADPNSLWSLSRGAWTPARSVDPPLDQRAIAAHAPALRFTVARFSDNELVLFATAAQESWIVYPPQCSYTFLRIRRATSSITVVEHHPWAPFSKVEDHHLRLESACARHGITCAANEVIQAATQLGFNPFV